MLKYTVSLYTSIPFGLKALYRNIIIPQNENERERNTDIRLIKHLNGHLPNAHNTIPAAHKTSIGIFFLVHKISIKSMKTFTVISTSM